MTTATRMAVPALLGALLMALPAPARATEQRETERIDRTAQIRAGGQLRLKNFSGRVTITGSNRADMTIHAVRTATRDRLDHIKLDIQETSSGVTIEANRKDSDWRDRDNNVVETEFDIEVPADIDLDILEAGPDRVWSSRQHAAITWEAGKCVIEDLNSANGTYVNRARVRPGEKRALQPGDVVQIGEIQFKLLVP